VAVRIVTFLLLIQEVPDSNLGIYSGYPVFFVAFLSPSS
jgi:hypothetical protein